MLEQNYHPDLGAIPHLEHARYPGNPQEAITIYRQNRDLVDTAIQRGFLEFLRATDVAAGMFNSDQELRTHQLDAYYLDAHSLESPWTSDEQIQLKSCLEIINGDKQTSIPATSQLDIATATAAIYTGIAARAPLAPTITDQQSRLVLKYAVTQITQPETIKFVTEHDKQTATYDAHTRPLTKGKKMSEKARPLASRYLAPEALHLKLMVEEVWKRWPRFQPQTAGLSNSEKDYLVNIFRYKLIAGLTASDEQLSLQAR